MYQPTPPRPPRETLPTMYDLPTGNPGENPEEPGLPDHFHLIQPRLLSDTFQPPAYGADERFTASDMNLYYDARHTQWYKRPDWFAALGVPRLYDGRDMRMSYVTWQEPANPYVVVELISPGTEKEDLGQVLHEVGKPLPKWKVYEQALRIPYYIVYDRYSDILRFFVLKGGSYEAQQWDEGRFWIPELGIGLGLWQGSFEGIERDWLRWFDQHGQWIPTPTEVERRRVAIASEAVAAERAKAEAERQKAERLMAQLRSLGVEPEL